MPLSFRNAPVHDALLTPKYRAAAREAAIRRFQWFVHDTPKSNFASIRRYGIKRTDDGALYTPVSVERLHGRLPPTVCLAPGPNGWANAIAKAGPFARFAIRSSKIPASVGLDWTYPYNWNLASVIADDTPHMSVSDVFAEVVSRTRVLVCYSPISAKWLRVLTNDASPDDPGRWPSIWNVRLDRIGDAA